MRFKQYLPVAMASQISGIEGVVIAGLASGDTSVITTHSPAATIFHIDESGVIAALR